MEPKAEAPPILPVSISASMAAVMRFQRGEITKITALKVVMFWVKLKIKPAKKA